jgi:hypothetical protein
MYKITVTTTNNTRVTIFFSSHLTIQEDKVVNKSLGHKQVTIIDGLHNNGGWSVLESYEQVIDMIEAQINPFAELSVSPVLDIPDFI